MKIKGFDKNLCCRGMQFEIGKDYDTGAKEEELVLCSDTVFHYCDSLKQVHSFYNCAPDAENRFCEIHVLGKEITDGQKCGSNKITIVREIVGEELNFLRGMISGNVGIFNSGNWNSGDSNSGNRNSGNRNSGNRNSGDRNSGDWNSGNGSVGFFCTAPQKVCLFNKLSDFTQDEFRQSVYYRALTSVPFELTEWVAYSKEEKLEDEQKELIGGYLKPISYKEACKVWWNKMSLENKKIVKSIPGFDAEIFKEITGISVA